MPDPITDANRSYNQDRIYHTGNTLDKLSQSPPKVPNEVIPYSYFYVIAFKNSVEKVEEDFRVNFQFLPPQFVESKSANYEDLLITGYSIPLKTYTGSSSNVISVVFEFFALNEDEDKEVSDTQREAIVNTETNKYITDLDIDFSKIDLSGDSSSISTVTSIFKNVQKLKSLVYSGPFQSLDNFKTYPPKLCWLRLGHQLGMWCICKNVQVTYKTDPTPWDLDLLLPFGVSVQCTFEEIEYDIKIPTNYDVISTMQPGNLFQAPSTQLNSEDANLFRISEQEEAEQSAPPATSPIVVDTTPGVDPNEEL